MGDLTIRGTAGEMNLASRKAEEAALRRYQAVHWLDYLVGPLGMPSNPSEEDFISCLRNGLILCNVINIVQPGSVTKVVETSASSTPLLWDSQPLPAYQYFENIRNFLVAVSKLKLPNFEASVFERDNLQEGSSTKVVDCILALKAYHEWKQMTGGEGVYKPPKSPLALNSASRMHVRTPHLVSHNCSRKLDMSGGSVRSMRKSDIKQLEDMIVKALEEHLMEQKENMHNQLISSYNNGSMHSVSLSKIISSFLEEQIQRTFPEVKSSALDHVGDPSCAPFQPTSVPLEDLSNIKSRKCCKACLKKGNCNHWILVDQQEKELLNVKLLLSSAKKEFEFLQSQLQSDLRQLGDQVLEMSSSALAYESAVKENRNLYNMVQDLKGNIRVYCRIRPIFNPEMQNAIDFIGDDGTLVVFDPKHPKNAKQMFQFNCIFDPTATQDQVFGAIRPLIRSVMDGYNACIFAYGQSGSGKTYTMWGSPDSRSMELGISYLALNDLLELSIQRKDITGYKIQVQMVEIHNEQVNDLLAEDVIAKKLELPGCLSDNSLALTAATLFPVKSSVDIMNVMSLAVRSAAANTRATHSHCVLSVHVHGEDASGSMLHSCLHLVDLAGTECMSKLEVSGDGSVEALHVDKSLACFVDVITSLPQKNSQMQYHNSKLTSLLQNSLGGGKAKVLMLAHVSPEGDSFGETMNTLRFAQRVSAVELGAARANKERAEVLELKKQVESLRKALGNKEWLSPLETTEKAAGTPPCKKPKQAAERTPSKPKRLNIENGCSIEITKPTQTNAVRTPTKPRRLSIEHGSIMVAKTPCEIPRPKQSTERTPPKPRRLSIENGSRGKTPETLKPKQTTVRTPPNPRLLLSIENGSTGAKTDRTPPPLRRSSIENGTTVVPVARPMTCGQKDNNSMIVAKSPSEKLKPLCERTPPPRLRRLSIENGTMARVMTCGQKEKDGSLRDLSNLRTPKSPLSSAFRSPVVRIDTLVSRTPEPMSMSTVQRALHNDSSRIIASEINTPCSTQRKESKTKKSILSFGKFMNGSEKRKQQKQAEAMAPCNNTTTGITRGTKSPTSSNAKTLKRQSLTGLQAPSNSRRSSLGGGAPTNSDGNEDRKAKTTPPRVGATAKLMKRWL